MHTLVVSFMAWNRQPLTFFLALNNKYFQSYINLDSNLCFGYVPTPLLVVTTSEDRIYTTYVLFSLLIFLFASDGWAKGEPGQFVFLFAGVSLIHTDNREILNILFV